MYWLFALSFGVLLCSAGITSDSYCRQTFTLPTECIPLRSCSILRRQFEEGKGNTQIIKYFQKLTCGFDAEFPRICCPIKGQPSEIASEPDVMFLSSRSQNRNFSEHENFKFIPKLENCGSVNIIDRIVGGTNAPFGSYPWLARIGYKVSSIKDIQYGCAATIISSRYLISAAHCLQGIDPNIVPYQIRLAEYDSSKNPDCISDDHCIYTKDIIIENVIAHPDYVPGIKFHDIALIRLKEEISFDSYIQPVCLPFTTEFSLDSFHVINPSEVYIAGWGKLKWNGEGGSSILQHTKLPVVPNDICQDLYSMKTKLRIMDTQMCTGGGSMPDSCSGDSGGPTLINYHKGVLFRTFQVGIISFGASRCGSEDSPPSVCTRIIPYLGWILNSMGP